jgi:hypothetical protein
MLVVIGMGYMEWTRLKAVLAAGAYLLIDIHGSLFTSLDGIGRANGHAARIAAVVTLVGKEVPPDGAI